MKKIFIACITLSLFSCLEGNDCDQMPDTSSIDKALLDSQVAELEAHLDSLGVDYLTDPSGVLMTILEVGEGGNPNFCSTVNLTYGLSLVGESEFFDSAINQNYQLSQQNLIKGWYFGLYNMRAKGEYILYIPAELAYGETGSKNSAGDYIVQPNENLQFRMRINQVFNN